MNNKRKLEIAFDGKWLRLAHLESIVHDGSLNLYPRYKSLVIFK